MGVGFRVFGRAETAPREQIATLGRIETSNLADAMNGQGCMTSAIRPVYAPSTSFAGPALTVTLSPGNGIMIRAAIDVSQPGDVIVVNAGGVMDRAVLGGNVAIDMVAHGISGVVVDGVVRDVDELRELGLPVLARGVTPRSGSDRSGRGEVSGPIACGGVVVMPGDVVVVDADGVVVVPLPDIGAVCAAGAAVQARKGGSHDLTERLESARGGVLTAYDPTVVLADLRNAGCERLDYPWRVAAPTS